MELISFGKIRVVIIMAVLISIFGRCSTSTKYEKVDIVSTFAGNVYSYDTKLFDKKNNLIIQDTIILEMTCKLMTEDSTQNKMIWFSKKYPKQITGYHLKKQQLLDTPPTIWEI